MVVAALLLAGCVNHPPPEPKPTLADCYVFVNRGNAIVDQIVAIQEYQWMIAGTDNRALWNHYKHKSAELQVRLAEASAAAKNCEHLYDGARGLPTSRP